MAMRIVTINLPHPYIKAMKILIDIGLYRSRSQVVRVCLTEFLAKEDQFLTELNDGSISQIKEVMELLK